MAGRCSRVAGPADRGLPIARVRRPQGRPPHRPPASFRQRSWPTGAKPAGRTGQHAAGTSPRHYNTRISDPETDAAYLA